MENSNLPKKKDIPLNEFRILTKINQGKNRAAGY
jgi:hypothetical protein